MTLFDFNASSQLLSHGPLAHRMRPMNLNDFIGHSDIIGDNSIIKNALENNQLFSMIFWGPPGCGKTTLAKLIGNTDNYIFSEMSAVVSGVADIKKQLSNAQKSLSMYSKRSVLFIDEIHRFNKSNASASISAFNEPIPLSVLLSAFSTINFKSSTFN